MANVSIIMGAYNVDKTLRRAVDSILSQTYTDWDFVICDDGSSDKTMQLLDCYKAEYPEKFIIIQNDVNRGLTYTLNHCLKYAKGKYIARMDADDISLPERLGKEVEFLDVHPEIAFVGCSIERFDENGVWKESVADGLRGKEAFYKSSGFVHPTIMIKREALEAVSGYREAWYTNRCEDYDLWMRLYANGFTGYNLPIILFQYYEGKDSFPKRKYKYRIGEAVMRFKGYKELGLLPKGIIYALKPLVAGLIPRRLIKKVHSR